MHKTPMRQIIGLLISFLAPFKKLAAHPHSLEHSAHIATSHMIRAITDNNLEKLNAYLMQNNSANCRDSHANTPLILAASNNNHKAVLLLLEHGANLEDTNKFGISAFLAAIMMRHLAIAQTLLQHSAKSITKEELEQTLQYRETVERSKFSSSYHKGFRSIPPSYLSKYRIISQSDLIMLCKRNELGRSIILEKRPTRHERLTRYHVDILSVIGKESDRIENMFNILCVIFPNFPANILQLIISFETIRPIPFSI